MRAVILVGGLGSRLRPLTYTTPKQLLPILDVPMIERKIAHLVAHGVDDIIFSMGYRPDTFFEAFPDNKVAGANITYVVEKSPLGTAGAIAFAAREAGINETFLAMNGDTLTDLNVGELISLHKKSGAEGTITLTPVDDPSRFGVVPTEDDGRVIAFIEKPPRDEAPTNLINAGTYVLEPAFIDRVPENKEVSIEREVFPDVVADKALYAGHFDTYWLDIGTPEAYLQGNLDAIDNDLGGGNFIGQGASIHGNTTVHRSIVGKGSTVAQGAVLRETVLLPGAVIEEGATIENSIIGENATIGAGSHVSDLTVVGGNLTVAALATLKNEKVNPAGA